MRIKIFELHGLNGCPQLVSDTVLPQGNSRLTAKSALSASICKTLSAIKIGSEILRYSDARPNWIPVNLGTPSEPDDLRLTFDDFRVFKDILVVFKRGRDPTASKKLEKNAVKSAQNARDRSSSSEEESSAEDSVPSSSSEEAAPELSAYESCSQGSTEYSSYNEELDDEESKEPSVSGDALEEAASEADDSSVSCSDGASDASDSSDHSRERVIVTNEQFVGQLYADDRSSDDESQIFYYSGDSDDSFIYARPSFPDADKPRQEPGGAFKCSIGVFDLKSDPSARLFHYEQYMPVMLYDSPPVIHPTRPLIVWPISCGDILFADYEENRYFLRQSRATSSFSKMHP